MSRRLKTVIGIVAALLAIPALAFAASFVVANFGGQAGFTESSAAISITSITNGGSTGKVSCADFKQTSGTTFEISPKAERLTIQGGATQVTPGNCTLLINVKNTGTTTLALPGVAATAPQGWTITRNEESKTDSKDGKLAPNGAGIVVLQATASADAVGGGITGTLTGDTADVATP